MSYYERKENPTIKYVAIGILTIGAITAMYAQTAFQTTMKEKITKAPIETFRTNDISKLEATVK